MEGGKDGRVISKMYHKKNKNSLLMNVENNPTGKGALLFIITLKGISFSKLPSPNYVYTESGIFSLLFESMAE